MKLDDELTPREHSEMLDLVLAGTQRIRPAGSRRVSFVAAGTALALFGAVAGGILTVALTQDRPPDPVAFDGTIPNGGAPPPSTPTDVDPQVWISELPVGTPPFTPYWHAGVMHVRGAEIETSFDVRAIEVAGDTVMVGGEPTGDGVPTTWWLVDGDQLEQLPASDEYYPALSADGRIAYWQTSRSSDTTTLVMWDTVADRELATRTVSGRFSGTNRLHVIGVDADGIAYWVDESSDTPVMRWDVRADTVEPTDLRYDASKTLGDQTEPLGDLWVGFEDAYVSPDGTRQVFTDQVPSDSPEDCCVAQLRVRPVGPLGAVEPDSITTLQLPDGILGMRLWDAYSDRGTWGVWWETNETVLLDAIVDGQSSLVRCWADGGTCELVFDLGPNASSGILYMPEWEQSWAFGRFPVTE